MSITITEALSQLKLLDKRITSATQGGGFVFYIRPGQTLQGAALNVEDIKKKTLSSFQSVKDLIARRDKIKAAIVVSNATTKVRVGNETITVAAAIEKKSSIDYQKALIFKLQTELNQAMKDEKARLDMVEQQILTLFTTTAVANEEDRKILVDNHRKNNLGVIAGVSYDEIEALVQESEEFLRTIDTVLTISNSITKIEVD